MVVITLSVLYFIPLLSTIPSLATTSTLLVVGVLIMGNVPNILEMIQQNLF
ncbi:MAG: hypothetical protein O4805_06555 [Trichodesmium sp. St16_bin2-tuft]|nr:hypothetical protein [Trichodesmium sp. St16_bin2-tuft]MDE5123220.1 hypothetical protein [Trichodesmium sp. St19_bin1]